MPSIMSHYLLSKRMIEYVKQNYPKEEFAENAVIWGGQGPDFLYSFVSKSTENDMFKYASSLHRTPANDTLEFLSNFAKASKNEIDKGYVVGFLSHFAFDSIAHPFVLYASKEISGDGVLEENVCHWLLETNVDLILLRYEDGKTGNELHLKNCAPKDDKVCQHITTIYNIMGQKVFGKDYNMDDIYKATKDYVKKMKKDNDFTGMKKTLAQRKEKRENTQPTRSVCLRGIAEDDDYDYANISNSVWCKDGQECTDSFIDMFEQASDLAKKLVDAFLNNGDIAPLAQNKTMMG